MQKQSDQYHAALYEENVVQSRITGTIRTINGESYDLTDDDIIPGSLGKNNKCVNGSSFELGSVFQGELNVTLKKTFDRYKLMDAAITFTERRLLKDGKEEDVKIGTFYIADAEHSKKLTTIKAVDSMGKLDIDVIDDMVGTPYDLLSMMAEKCGVELAQTEEEIAGLPNGQQLFSVYQDTTETYRDMAAYLGMVTGTFATFNVDDKLEMKSYALQDCLEVPAGKRDSGSTAIADYITYYRGIQARFIAEENYAPYAYEDPEIANGLILDLGDVPIVRGLPETKHDILQALFEIIKQIRYTPAEFDLVTSDAALELGDRIGIGGENVSTYITSYDWTYHGTEKLKGVGDNPRLKAAKDKTSKQMGSLEEKVNGKEIILHTYTNAADYTLKAEEKEIISFNYAAVADTRPLFIATIPFTAALDGRMIFRYYIDGVILPDDTVMEYVLQGEHFATLSNNMSIEKDTRRTLTVTACIEYVDSEIRQQAAAIESIEAYLTTAEEGAEYVREPADPTPPTAEIKKGTIRAVLYAQGLSGAIEWDGTLNLVDEIPLLDPGDTPLLPFTADQSIGQQVPQKSSITEQFGLITEGISLLGFEAVTEFNDVYTNYTFSAEKAQKYAYNSTYVDTSGSFRMRKEYQFAGRMEEIDEGSLCAAETDTEQFTVVLDIEAAGTGDKYLIQTGQKYYHVSEEGSLQELGISDLTKNVFDEYGNDEPPSGELLKQLANPAVLCWSKEGEAEIQVTISAVPPFQTVISERIDLTHSSIKGVENMRADCEGELICAVSFDDMGTWQAWNGDGWSELSSDYAGMGKEILEGITMEQWGTLYTGADSIYIRIALTDPEQVVKQIYVDFAN